MEALSTTEPPAQNVVGPIAVIIGVGEAFTVTVIGLDVAEQPLALVTTTEYDPEVLTVMLWVVKLPGVHK